LQQIKESVGISVDHSCKVFGSNGPVVLMKGLKCEKFTDRRHTQSDDKSSIALPSGKQKMLDG